MNAPAPFVASELTPLVRRIQKALLDGHVLTIQSRRYAWVPAGAILPDLDDQASHMYQAHLAGVFQEATITRGAAVQKGWLHWGHLDDLDRQLGPTLESLSSAERESLSADLAFQVVMREDQQARSKRRLGRS